MNDLINRKQALKDVKLWVGMNWYEQHLIRDVIKWLEEFPSPWIPVAERLPNKEEKSYWVCLEDGGQCQCRWTNDVYGLGANEWSKWGWKKVDLPQYSKVVAYMPLPEPYKGVTE